MDLDVTAAANHRSAVPERPTLRFSVAAMQSPQDTFAAYSRLFERLGERLGVRIEFVQRRTYAEVNDLIAAGRLDAALVCTGGWLELARTSPGAAEVLAVPVVGGKRTYRSLLIVPVSSSAHSIADLRGKRFGFTDELSLSGYGYPVHLLHTERHDPRTFFGSVLFTHSHDRSIEAVAKGVLDGAAVDSLVFDQVVRARPEIGRTVRIIHRSPEFGAAPVIASTRLSHERRAALRDALLRLTDDPDAIAAMRIVGFDRFEAAGPGLFRDAAVVMDSTR